MQIAIGKGAGVKKRSTVLWLGVVIATAGLAVPASAAATGLVFPAPRESSATAGDFVLDQTSIVARSSSSSSSFSTASSKGPSDSGAISSGSWATTTG